MKLANKWTLHSLLGATLICAACVDSDKDFSQSSESEQTTLELKVPNDFPWSTTRSVNVKVDAPVTSIVSFYTEAGCPDESLVAEIPVSSGKVTEVEIDVPAYCKSIYVKYPTGESTTSEVEVKIQEETSNTRAINNLGNVNVGADKLLGMYEMSIGNDPQGLSIYVTSGSVVFEDNWPNLGDYDFNDLVADYRIETHISAGSDEQYPYERIEVSVTIRAIGGYLPEKLGLRFMGNKFGRLLQRYIGKYTGLDKPVNGLTVKLANPNQPDSEPIFYIEGLKQLRNGADFYNTEKKDDANLTTVTFGMYADGLKNNLDASKGFSQAAYAVNQDFFLVTAGKREIHLRGYEPTAFYTSYAEEAASSRDAIMSSNMKYSTDKNFVWGMKVVKDFHFPLEKKDICQAYKPYFAQWVESNGGESDNWFKYWTKNPGFTATW